VVDYLISLCLVLPIVVVIRSEQNGVQKNADDYNVVEGLPLDELYDFVPEPVVRRKHKKGPWTKLDYNSIVQEESAVHFKFLAYTFLLFFLNHLLGVLQLVLLWLRFCVEFKQVSVGVGGIELNAFISTSATLLCISFLQLVDMVLSHHTCKSH